MYATMSISTRLYPKLDLQNANKLHYKIRRKPVHESMGHTEISTTDDGYAGISYPCLISFRIRIR